MLITVLHSSGHGSQLFPDLIQASGPIVFGANEQLCQVCVAAEPPQCLIDGSTITIADAGGVGDHITWSVIATDASGNQAARECEVLVAKPGKKK